MTTSTESTSARQSTAVDVDIQIAIDKTKIDSLPSHFEINQWVNLALQNKFQFAELTVRVVGIEEITQLNKQYRHKNEPTNVLTFEFSGPAEIQTGLLGDIVICAPVIQIQANEQKKPIKAHWAHIIIHGVLHLLGYDHIKDADAQIMETLEIELLSELGFKNPYVEVEGA